MNDLIYPKGSKQLASKDQQSSQFFGKSLYIKEDDQDWGSAGMNDVHEDSK
jgi:hypothetical protein|tara:strand:+ start:230 stop:382 length:153 start_codon:yes stop_codon:yes gene_type:complete